jgi:hypothetical protein
MRLVIGKTYCLALLLITATGMNAAAQLRSPAYPFEISFGVSGNAGPEDSYNPLIVVYQRWPRYAPILLGLINYTRPRSITKLVTAAQLPDSIVRVVVAALDTCGMIRRENDHYQVTFAVFDDDVWAAFTPVMSSISDAIAERVESEIVPRVRAEYPRTQLARNGVPFEIAAPVIIGRPGSRRIVGRGTGASGHQSRAHGPPGEPFLHRSRSAKSADFSTPSTPSENRYEGREPKSNTQRSSRS